MRVEEVVGIRETWTSLHVEGVCLELEHVFLPSHSVLAFFDSLNTQVITGCVAVVRYVLIQGIILHRNISCFFEGRNITEEVFVPLHNLLFLEPEFFNFFEHFVNDLTILDAKQNDGLHLVVPLLKCRLSQSDWSGSLLLDKSRNLAVKLATMHLSTFKKVIQLD